MDEHPDRDERDRPDEPDDDYAESEATDGEYDESDAPDDDYAESDAEYDENDAYAGEYDENDSEYDDDDVDGPDDADEYEPDDEYESDPDQDHSADHARSRIRPGLAFVMGTLVGLLALGGIWAYASLTGSSDAQAGTPRHAAAAATVLGTQQTQTAAAAEAGREATCRKAWDAQAPALRAAASTLDQWEVHVGAMNKLVVGAISMQQANAFWNQTRVGATQRLVRYLAADQQAMNAVARCSQAAGASSSATLRECARAVKARARTLHVAQVSVSTWKHHVRDMEMLRMGHLTPAQANKMWLESWHKGMKQLHAYREAANASSGLSC